MKQVVYKVDSKGKARFLKVSTEGADLIQESGLLDGKSVTHRSTSKGKNIGRANETTPESQAEFDAQSKLNKKLKGEYFPINEDLSKLKLAEKIAYIIEEAKNNIVILPMLAKTYKNGDIYPCYCQPKLDGQRNFGKNDIMTSRENSPITTLPHIQNSLKTLPDGQIIDGEVYAHGLSFQENMKLIGKLRPESINVKYHVYDLVSDDPFEIRYTKLKILIRGMDHVELVPTYRIENEEQLKEYHAKFLSEGYEGTIVRWGNEGYENNKRSKYLLKYKDFIDIACEVIDVIPSEKRPEHGVVVVRLDNGIECKCGMKFSHKEREEILINRDEYIGQTAEVRFFEYSDTGVPRFPVCVGFRLDK